MNLETVKKKTYQEKIRERQEREIEKERSRVRPHIDSSIFTVRSSCFYDAVLMEAFKDAWRNCK